MAEAEKRERRAARTAKLHRHWSLEEISSVTINGQPLEVEGYLDIGLHDTMADLFVNFIGAVVFSVIGYVYIRQRGKGGSGRLLQHFLPALEEDLGQE